MVTETPEDTEVKRIGAVASLGGAVEDLFMSVKETTTAGHRKVFWPLVLLTVSMFLIITGMAAEGWLRGLTGVLLALIAIWVVADDVKS